LYIRRIYLYYVEKYRGKKLLEKQLNLFSIYCYKYYTRVDRVPSFNENYFAEIVKEIRIASRNVVLRF